MTAALAPGPSVLHAGAVGGAAHVAARLLQLPVFVSGLDGGLAADTPRLEPGGLARAAGWIFYE